ncbi:DUF3106 domain-containing protein [Undibacterium sp. SXout11W]|uniref:DUF3106 domain-containing protein n=1 Tax=Undibacterium sp. SXout11W TaxID=3413050 RepID=UPI003BF35DAB
MPFCNLRHLITFTISFIVLPLAFANGATPSPSVTPASAAATPAKLLVPPTTANQAKPHWSALSPAQQQALAPLVAEWPLMPETRKKKWLEIATRYAAMKPDEQQRLQERMRDWVKLTPEQRASARENYAHATQLDPERKSAQWEQYQQLSAEEKKRLADEHEKKKRLTNLSSETIKNPQIIAPIKVGPNAVKTNKAPTIIKPATPTALGASTSASAASITTPPAIPAPETSASAANTTQAVSK